MQNYPKIRLSHTFSCHCIYFCFEYFSGSTPYIQMYCTVGELHIGAYFSLNYASVINIMTTMSTSRVKVGKTKQFKEFNVTYDDHNIKDMKYSQPFKTLQLLKAVNINLL